MIVAPKCPPRAIGHFSDLDKAPIAGLAAGKSKIIPHGGSQVESSPIVLGIHRAGSAKNIFGVGGIERSAVAPLSVTSAVAVTDGHPPVLTDGSPEAPEGLLIPRDHLGGFRLHRRGFPDVIVRQGDIKGILL